MKEYIFNFENINYKILIGSNSRNYWELLDNANPNDVLFHLDQYSSSYIILLNNNFSINEIPRQIIKRCACLCKSHSSSKSLTKITIKYASIKYCYKGRKEGELYMNNTRSIII